MLVSGSKSGLGDCPAIQGKTPACKGVTVSAGSHVGDSKAIDTC